MECAGKTWSDVYGKPADVDGYVENISVHKDFLVEILRHDPKSILEAGCGSATLSIFFSHLGKQVTAVDIDKDIIERAKISSDALGGSVKFGRADAFTLPFGAKSFDAVFSQGVLEHFSDEDIVKLLREQLRVSKKVFFSVPNAFYNHRDFGNERLLGKRQWEKILSGFDIFLSRDYYRISAKRNFLVNLPIMYMAGIQ
jgi:ubiquinone/menaquinone biosynthesis C-methylase UbiE